MVFPRRVGVLTFHRCINYGSYWQALCLVEGLRSRGHDAVLLDHHSGRVNMAEWRCALHPIPEAPRGSHREAYVEKTRKFFAAFNALPLSRPFPLDAPEQAEATDVILVGSDEVWNQRHPWYGNVPLFYGQGLKTGRLASYAASFGNQSATETLDQHWSSLLDRFDAISVRDANSEALVRSALRRDPTMVLDPCLMFSDIIPKDSPDEQSEYALVYGHGFPDWLVERVTAWAREGGVRLVSIGYDNSWADVQQIQAGPHDFAAFVAGAKAVITNFFHGCVFSLVNNKPFVTVPTPYRFNKIRDLVDLLGAEAHLVDDAGDAETYRRLLSRPPNPAITARIDALRQQSSDYLDHVLA